MTTFLLDVNVLIALADPAHVQHDPAHEWFRKAGAKAFATCPITENGLLRIVGHPRYPNSPGNPSEVAAILLGIRKLPGHVFWSDDVSLMDPRLVETKSLLSASQITDSYLLALAQAHEGRLATFDRKLVATAVRNGAKTLQFI